MRQPMFKGAALLIFTMMLVGCQRNATTTNPSIPSIEQGARDGIAAAYGWITNAQSQWGDSCRQNNAQLKCTSTNRLITAQHTAADALVVYCGGAPAAGQKSYLDGGVCRPNTSAFTLLQSALLQMNSIVADVKALIDKGGN